VSKIVNMQHLARVEQTSAHNRIPAAVVVCFVEGGPSFIAVELRSSSGHFNAAQTRELAALLCKGADILDAAEVKP
jgi:hypothetical protein